MNKHGTLIRALRPALSTILLTALQLAATPAFTQTEQPDSPAIEAVTVMVTGRRPGPPLWEVSNGAKVLYIFGYLSPLPKRMRWESDRVLRVLEQAQEFIGKPTLGWNSALPRELVQLPHDQKLQDVLPQQHWDSYLQFTTDHYKRHRSIERMRPVFAASALTNALYDRHDLTTGVRVLQRIDRLAKQQRNVRITDPNLPLPEHLVARLDASAVTAVETLPLEQELACFDTGLAQVMRNITLSRQAANAWAAADMGELRYLLGQRPETSAPQIPVDAVRTSCRFSLIDDDALQAELDAALGERMNHWLTLVDIALNNNTTTFAVLDISLLLDERLLLDKLRARGYTVRGDTVKAP